MAWQVSSHCQYCSIGRTTYKIAPSLVMETQVLPNYHDAYKGPFWSRKKTLQWKAMPKHTFRPLNWQGFSCGSTFGAVIELTHSWHSRAFMHTLVCFNIYFCEVHKHIIGFSVIDCVLRKSVCACICPMCMYQKLMDHISLQDSQ